MTEAISRRPSLWLALGAALVFLSQLRFGLGLFAWAAPVALLQYLRHTSGWRSRAAFVGVMVLTWQATVMKIVTAPVPFAFTPIFAVPLAVASALPYLGWSVLRSRTGPSVTAAAFAAFVVISEWSLHALLPFGAWGALANTQLENLALLQVASLTGLHGVSFLIAWLAAGAESLLADPRGGRRAAALPVAAMIAAVLFGQARLAAGAATNGPTTRVAAIDTEATFGGLPLPTSEEVERVNVALLRRTREAARGGAKLVVWTEGATLARPKEEAALLERVREVAAQENVYVAASWIVPVHLEPLRYENKLLLVGPDGALRYQYLKHHPVPGEPAIPGAGPMPVAVDPALGRISGAICYDYDFSRLVLAHAAVEADLVALPSSDWRGIDPLHTQMAAVRAIESGASVVRSTRFGLSAAIDHHGRLRAWQSHWERNRGVMIAELPARRQWTFYGWAGDWFIVASALFAAAMLVAAVIARYPRRRAARPGYSVARVAGAVPVPGRGPGGSGA